MNKAAHQLDLFQSPSLNPTYEIKRQIRLALADTSLSRAEIADRMNEISAAEGMRKSITKAQLDNWAKDFRPGSAALAALYEIFCLVLETTAPIAAMMRPLGSLAIDPEEALVLKWAHAELAKRNAIKRACQALEVIE